MTRVWTILAAAVTVFLVHSLAEYSEESSELFAQSQAVVGSANAAPRRPSSTRIDGTWLSAELPRIKNLAPQAPSARQ